MSRGFLILYAFIYLLLDLFFPPCCPTDALASANTRISLLEAELSASQKAFDATTATKVSAEKSNKSALAKAKKAEKALADANKEHLQREQAVTERLNAMSAAAGGTYCTLLLLLLLLLLLSFACFLILAYIFFFCCFLSSWFYRIH
jgi:Flp pilus assembly protein TadB